MNERKRRIAGLAALIPTTVFALGNLGGGAVSAESNRELLIGPVPITRSDVEIEASRENLQIVDRALEYVNLSSNAQFFEDLEKRRNENPSEYFRVIKMPNADGFSYYPDGKDSLRRFTYSEIRTSIPEKGPFGEEYIRREDEVYFQIGTDGTLFSPASEKSRISLKKIRESLEAFFRIPEEMSGDLWTEVLSDSDNQNGFSFGVVFKQKITSPLNSYDVGGNTRGDLFFRHEVILPKLEMETLS